MNKRIRELLNGLGMLVVVIGMVMAGAALVFVVSLVFRAGFK